MNRDAFLTYLKGWRRKPLLIALAVLGILLLAFGGLSTRQSGESKTEDGGDAAYLAALESELEALLREVRGVGRVEVMVTLERGERRSYSGSKLLASEMPTVKGVAVVCTGGGRPEVRAEVSGLLSSLLGIGTHRIHISEKRA